MNQLLNITAQSFRDLAPLAAWHVDLIPIPICFSALQSQLCWTANITISIGKMVVLMLLSPGVKILQKGISVAVCYWAGTSAHILLITATELCWKDVCSSMKCWDRDRGVLCIKKMLSICCCVLATWAISGSNTESAASVANVLGSYLVTLFQFHTA